MFNAQNYSGPTPPNWPQHGVNALAMQPGGTSSMPGAPIPQAPGQDPRAITPHDHSGRMGSFDMSAVQNVFNQNQGDFDGYLNALRGMWHPGQMGQGPQMGGAPIPGTPAMPNTQFPLNPGGPIQGQQVGSQLGVAGATPATSPFGLPGY